MGDLKRKILKLFSGGGRAVAGDEPVAVYPSEYRELPRIGSVLRSARTEAGLELRDVASMLKIRYVFMEALEDGRYSDLPGTAYAVGFVRTYADYLGLDRDAVVRTFKDEVAGKGGRQNLYFPTPVPEGKVPGGTVLLISLVLACLVYGSWYILSATDRRIVDVVPALPQRLLSLLDIFSHTGGAAPGTGSTATTTTAAPASASAPAAPPVGSAENAPLQPPLPVAEPVSPPQLAVMPGGIVLKPGTALDLRTGAPIVPTAPSVPTTTTTAPTISAAPAEAANDSTDEIPLVSGPSDEAGPGPLVPMAPRIKPPRPGAAAAAADTVIPVIPPTVVPGAPPAATDLGLPQGRVYGSQNHDSKLTIKAVQDTWVQVRDASGEALFTRVLHPGDTFRVPDRQGIRLRTGNAGGLTVANEGGEAKPLGQVGEVLRDVPVEPGVRSTSNNSGNN
ncbi:MAG: helix-turn-helix domain-containing protein [Rhodospirillaceae bacterium]